MANGRLIVQRNSEADLKMRDLLVRIDDAPAFNLNFGQTKELEIEAGEHTLFATNRLYSKTETFEIQSGATIAFEVANIPTGCLSLILMSVGMSLYRVTVQRLPQA